MSTNTLTQASRPRHNGEWLSHLELRTSELLNSLRLESEVTLSRGLRSWVDQHLDVAEAAEELKDYSYLFQNSYVELSAEDLGEKGRELQGIIRRLYPTLQLKVHLIPKTSYQAFTLTNPLDHRALFGVSTSMLRDFTAAELAFVFGHEIGHQLFGHTQEHNQLQKSLSVISDKEHPIVHLMQSLKRRGELSADRVGLIFCRDLKAGLRALCKVATDAPMKTPEISKSIYRVLSDDRQTYRFIDAEIDQSAPWLESHPNLSIRVQALRDFGELGLHLTLRQLDVDQVHELIAVNKRTESLLDVMEHDQLKRDQSLIRRFQIAIFTLSHLLHIPLKDWGQSQDEQWDRSVQMLKKHASFGRRARLLRALSFSITPDQQEAQRRLETLKRQLSSSNP